jgi:PAS domain S-box-containing protein
VNIKRATVGGVGRLWAVARGITKRKRAEEEPAARWRARLEHASLYFTDVTSRKHGDPARARLTAILEATSDFVATADAAHRVLYFNKAARQMLGIGQDEDLSTIRIEDTHPRWANDLLLNEGIPTAICEGIWSGETALLARDGREIQISQVIISHKAPDGTVECLSTIGRDITGRRRAEEFREGYLHAIAHDLRGPLGVIGGHAKLLQQGFHDEQDGSAQRSLSAISRAVQRMDFMIEEMVDSARLEAGQLVLTRQALDLPSLISDLLERVGATIDVRRINMAYPAGLPSVSADPDRLERILFNLLTNALKYSPETSEVLLRARPANGAVTVSISDEGGGIAPEETSRIFERFYRAKGVRKREGVGLGLYVSKMIVEAHGGCLWVESEVGRGSTFTFSLPTARADGPWPADSNRQGEPPVS